MQHQIQSLPKRPDTSPDYVGDRLISIKEVCQIVGIARNTVYVYMRTDGLQFPRPIKVGIRRVGWRASAIRKWIEEREAISRSN